MAKGIPNANLLAETKELRSRLAEAENTLRAIAGGEADALILSHGGEQQVHLIGTGDRVYRQFLESRSEGTAIIAADGIIRSCNAALVKTLRHSLGEVLGSNMLDHVSPEHHEVFKSLLTETGTESFRQLLHLKTGDGVPVPVYVSVTILENPETASDFCFLFRDTREVISTELILRESEQLYRELLELAPVGIAVFSDEKVAYMNPAGAHLLGAESENQLEGKLVEEFVVPDKNIDTQSQIERLKSGEDKIFSTEGTFIRLDGKPIEVEIQATPVKYKGEPAIQMIFTDITERKKAEAKLEFQNIILSTQQDVSIDAILVVGESGQLYSFNRQFIELWNISKELLDTNDDEMLFSHTAAQVVDREKFIERKKYLYSHPRESARDELVLNDGRVIDRYSASMFDPNDKYLGRVWYFRDITEIKRANGERERLMAAIEQLEETVVITDPEGTIEYVNPAFLSMTGYTYEETIGKNPRFLKSGEQNQEFYRNLWSTISSGKTWRGVIKNRSKNGNEYSVDSAISPVLDSDGRIINYVEVNHDIDARQLLEAQLQQAQKMEIVGQLAGGVAHDFNNMLQVIITYADMLLSMTTEGESQHKYLVEIRRAAQRSAELTGQLLTFARKQVTTPKVLNLNDALADAQSMIQRLIGEDIDLVWMPGADLWKVKIDPTQLDQIVANLAVNARDAIAGVGRLNIRTQKAVLDTLSCTTIPGSTPGEYLLLTVSDNGSGIDEETLEHLFEPFFTTKETGKGTGLGLATVYGIVTQNKGFIDIQSELGVGTTFGVYLPRIMEANDDDVAELEPDARQGGTETVLVVEDEPAILLLARESLKELGYMVFTASSPEEAIRISEEQAEPIHLLLTDVVMPQMNGRQLAARLVAARPSLKCLYMSGYTPDIVSHRGILGEGIKLINKPFSLSVLAEKVREILDE